MRVIRISYRNNTFYARLNNDRTATCLNQGLGFAEPVPLESATLLPVVWPTKVVCVGLNYKGHARELGMELPTEPLIFFKPPSAILSPGMNIVLPRASEQVDYEGELAVIIGQTARNVSVAEAPLSVFGYTCANDVTARDLQKKDGLFARAKGFDTFLPIGPWIETEVPDPSNLELTTLVNGQERQRANTSDMIFTPFEVVSFISSVMTLLPGDVILTGTPAGIGPLEPGDEVTVRVETVAELINPVLAEGDPAQEEAAKDKDEAAPVQ